jgi:putative tryptophan/tyrosine transport system substrate-binding protein
MAKRLELLKDAVPHLSRAAVLVKPDNPLFKSTLAAIQSAANSLKVDLQQFDARSPNEFEAAFLTMTRNRVEAIVLQEDAVFLGNLKQIIELAERQSLPLAGPVECSEAGGLIGYGADFLDMCRRAAAFVDKILRGTKPADIPVERATKFETVLNVGAAKKLGIQIPPLVMLRADRVIE